MNLKFTRFIDKNIGIPICLGITFYDRFINLFKSKPRSFDGVGKILLMKFWGFGNIILLTPAIKSIRDRFPEAEITFLTLSENTDLLENFPYVDKIIEIETKGVSKFLIDAVKVISLIRRQKFDLLVDFEQFARNSAIISYLSGVPRRVGFNTEGQMREGIYNLQVKYNNDQHMVKTFFDLVRAFGCKVSNEYKLIPPCFSARDKESVEKFLSNKVPNILIGVHAGTGPNATVRRWPVEKFAKLSDLLIEKFNAAIVFTGSRKERDSVDNILGKMKNKALNSAGIFNIPQLSCLISKCDLFISSDTGPLHLAAALEVPTVSFYGPNTPKIYGPWGKNHVVFYKNLSCSPCITNFNTKLVKCDNPRCILEIGVDEAFDGIADILKQ